VGAPANVRRLANLRLLAWALSLIGLFGCVDVLPASPRPPNERTLPPLLVPAPSAAETDAVVLVVLDGARWQDVFVGVDRRLGYDLPPAEVVPASRLLPNLHDMIAQGVAVGAPDQGEPMVASGPNFVSLPGYNEIFSGRPPLGCANNDCPVTRETTLVDELRASSAEVAVFSSWAPIARAAASNPAGVVLSTGEPGTRDFRPDRETADLALAYLKGQRPRFVFIGLGEPDEFAHRGDYRGYLGALRRADTVLGDLFALLAAMGPRGAHTSVLVTCDHGRGKDFRNHGAAWPESSRVWLVGAGGRIPPSGAVASGAHRLADVAPTIRALLGLPADPSPGAGSPIAAFLEKDDLYPRQARR
jgi:Metalloenzyme superfamily